MNQAQRQRVSERTEFTMQRLVDLLYSLPQFYTFHQYSSNISEASRHIFFSESPNSVPQRVLQQNSEAKRVVRLPRTMNLHFHSIVCRVALFSMVSSYPRLSTGQANSCYSNSECGIGASCVAGDSSTQVQSCVADPPCAGTTVGNCPVDVVAGQLTCIWRPDIDCSRDPTGCSLKNGSYGIYKCVSAERCDAYFGNAACSCKYIWLYQRFYTDFCPVQLPAILTGDNAMVGEVVSLGMAMFLPWLVRATLDGQDRYVRRL